MCIRVNIAKFLRSAFLKERLRWLILQCVPVTKVNSLRSIQENNSKSDFHMY